MRIRPVVSAACALLVSGIACGQSLRVGSKAPDLSVDTWVKGDRVREFEKGQVYVVEFWATWCRPCIANIPHLTKLQKEHGDRITVIGVAGAERGSNGLGLVKNFIRNSAYPEMGYTVAYDGDGTMWNSWMRAAGKGGIPAAYLVDGDGKIAWLGYPAGELDEAIKTTLEKTPVRSAGTPERGSSGRGSDEAARPFELMVGDKAPALDVSEWVKGEPVTGLAKGRVYVVEFWATWCGPCVASMPHLTELQKKYADKDVRVIGVTSEDDRGNTLDVVKQMVGGAGDEKIGYTIAWDNNTVTADAYRGGAGIRGIPLAFVIDREGRVAWIGHPQELDRPLGEVASGTWDIQRASMDYLESRKGDIAAIEIARALDGDDVEAAVKAVRTAANIDPEAAVNEAIGQFTRLVRAGNTELAYDFAARAMSTRIGGDARLLNTVAWTIVDPEKKPEDQDLDLAMKAAQKAYRVSNGKDAAIIDTLAAVYFERGEFEKAVEYQEKACKAAGDERLRAELNERLETYKKAAG